MIIFKIRQKTNFKKDISKNRLKVKIFNKIIINQMKYRLLAIKLQKLNMKNIIQ